MACYEYKITFSYNRALAWDVSIWQREVLPHAERSEWRRIMYRDVATLEGHVDPSTRLRQALRGLAV